MKVFISWSGNRSRAVAEAMRDWLPKVIQAVELWMSAEDMDKGARWASDIAVQLEKAKVGLICLTSENIESPWILFEAGALSKTLEKSFVCPYLLDFDPAYLNGPLVQFQATKAEKDDTKKLILTINNAMGENALDDKRIEEAFNVWWPTLEESLKKIPSSSYTQSSQNPTRDDRDILTEILELVRAIKRDYVDIPETEKARSILDKEMEKYKVNIELKEAQLRYELDLKELETSHQLHLEKLENYQRLELEKQKLEFEKEHRKLEQEQTN